MTLKLYWLEINHTYQVGNINSTATLDWPDICSYCNFIQVLPVCLTLSSYYPHCQWSHKFILCSKGWSNQGSWWTFSKFYRLYRLRKEMLKFCQPRHLFCLFSSFSHCNFNNINWKGVDSVLGIQTRGRSVVGADITMELFRKKYLYPLVLYYYYFGPSRLSTFLSKCIKTKQKVLPLRVTNYG